MSEIEYRCRLCDGEIRSISPVITGSAGLYFCERHGRLDVWNVATETIDGDTNE